MGCKVGNGLGLCVYFALMAGAVVVYIKYIVSHDEAIAAATAAAKGKEQEIIMIKKEDNNGPESYAYEEEVPALVDHLDESKEETTTS